MKRLLFLSLFASAVYAQAVGSQTTNTLQGVLFDAGCKDRSALNLSSPPETLSAAKPAETAAESQAKAKNTGAVSSHGINVDAKTIAAERADVLPHQVADLRTRQADPTCALTGSTVGYSLLLDDGRILNLDEGGNTMANEAVVLSKEGRAMLNGSGYGFKPRVRVVGRVRGDRVIVERLAFL